MNKTIYIRDADVGVWDRAKELAADGLSPIIVDALRAYVLGREARHKGFERILLAFTDSESHVPKKIAFYGRWIYDLQHPWSYSAESDDLAHRNFAVAETAKGGVAVFSWSSHDEVEYEIGHTFKNYSSFLKAAADPFVRPAIQMAMSKRGVEVEELDI
ncbi:MAG TPA: hypothetical protein VGL53_06320 [Bryobacteraceae bacterium]|jgi:hypothetical protein